MCSSDLIQASGGLSEADIKKMVAEAEKNAAEDKKRRALVEARNQGESLVHSTEKNLKEFGASVGDSERQAIERAIEELKTALGGEDVEAIKAKTEALTQASMKLGEAMYRQQQAGAANAGPGAGAGEGGDAKPDENVVDADFEEVDENRRKSG